MARTSVNVIGNCLATVVIARWEGQFPAHASVAPLTGAAGSDPQSDAY